MQCWRASNEMLEDQDSVSYTHWTLSQVSPQPWCSGDLSVRDLSIVDQPLLLLLQFLSWTGYVLREIKGRDLTISQHNNVITQL